MRRVDDDAALAEALRAPRFLLFKHSPVCPVSANAFRAYEAFVAAHPHLPTGWLDVLSGRALSQRVARATGVEHESPQALLLEEGRAVWDASHGAITEASLAEAASGSR